MQAKGEEDGWWGRSEDRKGKRTETKGRKGTGERAATKAQENKKSRLRKYQGFKNLRASVGKEKKNLRRKKD